MVNLSKEFFNKTPADGWFRPSSVFIVCCKHIKRSKFEYFRSISKNTFQNVFSWLEKFAKYETEHFNKFKTFKSDSALFKTTATVTATKTKKKEPKYYHFNFCLKNRNVKIILKYKLQIQIPISDQCLILSLHRTSHRRCTIKKVFLKIY